MSGVRMVVDHGVAAQLVDLLLAEAEVLDRLQQPVHARDHAVAAAVGKPAGEDLEHARTVTGPVTQRGREHGQLVVVGQQRRRVHGRQP